LPSDDDDDDDVRLPVSRVEVEKLFFKPLKLEDFEKRLLKAVNIFWLLLLFRFGIDDIVSIGTQKILFLSIWYDRGNRLTGEIEIPRQSK